MVVYEVNLSIDREIERKYRSWLDDHVRRILALPVHGRAALPPRPAAEEAGADDGRVHLTVQYALVDRAALAAYLEHHAPRCGATGSIASPGGSTRAGASSTKSASTARERAPGARRTRP